MEGEDREGK